MNLRQLLDQAVARHQAGDLATAEKLYRDILAQDPRQADALQLLGVIAHQVGRHQEAVDLIGRAIAFRRQVPEFHNNLGAALLSLARFSEAAAAFREAVRLNPKYAEAHNNLGNALKELGQLPESIKSLETAVRLRADYAEAHNNLGVARLDAGETDRAIACYQAALRLQPMRAEFHNNLGAALRRAGRLEEAEQALRTAVRLGPPQAKALNNLGVVLGKRGQTAEALAAFRQALALDPNFADAYANLGDLLASHGDKREAAAALEHAIRLKPDFVEAHNNLGGVLKELGRFADAHRVYAAARRLKPDYAMAHYNTGVLYRDEGRIPEAIAAFRTALCLKPDHANAHSGLAFAMLYDPAFPAEEILAEHRAWDERHAARLTRTSARHPNQRDPARRLRVGYVSADFRDHAVGRNIHPLLRHHDHAAFEVFAYSNTAKYDAMTARLRALTDHWREIQTLSDAAAADLVRADGIDILVDLSLHTGGNRLPIFARKPAPVQVTFAGYPGTTGLAAIDYRLTDPYLDPPGETDAFYTESSVRLPHSFWCFDPIDDDPAVLQRRPEPGIPFTWGCLNNPLKVNEAVLAQWTRILAAMPDSRLLLLIYTSDQRERFAARLAALGIAAERVEFLPPQSRRNYLAAYNRCDVILDTFPYNGHTTTCDALWMSVPVVTLAGRHAVARGGLSLLANLDLAALVARTADDYVRIALELARDRRRLTDLRATLRARMEASPLMDAPRFARDIEAALRTMWQRWCQRPPS